jgi:UDP-glucose 4-epimerase
MRYILLGGNGYYGRNFQYFLKMKGDGQNEIIVIDKEITVQFKGITYIQCNLTHFNFNFNSTQDTTIINFAAISFVDDSILNPDECINNNVKCLESAIQLCKTISNECYVKLIHI